MKRLAILSIALAAAGMSHAAEIYNNGPVVDAKGRSVIAPGYSSYGYGANGANGQAVADDFNIAEGQRWNLTSIDFFAYQTGAGGFTLQSATWSIVSTHVNSDVVLASGTTSLTNGGREGYRVSSTGLSNTQRGIYRAQADIADITLGAGHYFLRWSLTGSGASGPWQAPVADGRSGNAGQADASGEYLKLVDSASNLTVELPFALHGTVSAVPEPETYAMLLAGLALVGAAARRRKQA
ncbi:PEPxxWA-CTERM sorting domain-containing protein [Janthinobacterium fluminis]|uniref:PEPxxWA-CTERM sorting domain-containing protein n=1 Tax=Janthinobacterium fluminis TaxID=2987524 RepID=A0ABT5JXQ4_9BURK|nr:PEPxxWA-CTERM sorting domain-containing protein [Janthinobacterium fluminis]MDC8756821.1 PEPxxWA-CTERM sorting domain-containing protein [Janthinobacterium fluminis]